MEKLSLADLIAAETYTLRMCHEIDNLLKKAKTHTSKEQLQMGFDNFNKANMKFQQEIFRRLENL